MPNISSCISIETSFKIPLKNFSKGNIYSYLFGEIAVWRWVGIATVPAWQREQKGKGFSKKPKKYWELVEIAWKVIDLPA